MVGILAHALGARLEIVATTWAPPLDNLTHGSFDIGLGGISVIMLCGSARILGGQVSGHAD